MSHESVATAREPEERPRIGVYVCHCGSNIAGKIDGYSLTRDAGELPDVTIAREYKFMCSEPGQALIQEDIRDKRLTRVVVAACSPRMHEMTFRAASAKAGLNPYLFTQANIREGCSWVTADSDVALGKARRIVSGAVGRVRHLQPLEDRQFEVRPEVMVVGAGIAGIQAALDIADSGTHVYLVEREASIGGKMTSIDKTFPTLDCSSCILTPKMTSVAQHSNITLLASSEVTEVAGHVGDFKVRVRRRATYVDTDQCTGCGACWDACLKSTRPRNRVMKLDGKVFARVSADRPARRN